MFFLGRMEGDYIINMFTTQWTTTTIASHIPFVYQKIDSACRPGDGAGVAPHLHHPRRAARLGLAGMLKRNLLSSWTYGQCVECDCRRRSTYMKKTAPQVPFPSLATNPSIPSPPKTTQDKSVKAWDLRSPRIGDCARLLDAMPHAALSLAWLPHQEQVLALGAYVSALMTVMVWFYGCWGWESSGRLIGSGAGAGPETNVCR